MYCAKTYQTFVCERYIEMPNLVNNMNLKKFYKTKIVKKIIFFFNKKLKLILRKILHIYLQV